MPHLVLCGSVPATLVAAELGPRVARWGRAVIKTGDRWRRGDDGALLIEGVVVELGRPLHPMALVAERDGDTVVRLWPLVEVERTAAVQRFLGVVARGLQELGCGAVRTTNIPGETLAGLGLEIG
jgi:hypothetical protein